MSTGFPAFAGNDKWRGHHLATPMLASTAVSTFITAPDGLRLHAQCYGQRSSAATPVVCLPGLARTVADFEALASALTHDSLPPRRVIALDSRGRGRSGYDRNPANYSLPVELADVLAVVTALEALPAIFIGTSRGGILTMLLAAVRPTAIAAAVLNDIGPVLEPQGLMRIKSYIGKLPQPRNFEEGAEILRRLFGTQFPKLGQADWLASAHRTFKEEKGRLVPTYDVKLANALNGVDAERPVPALWKEFDALASVPVMVIRGANSDLLSAPRLRPCANGAWHSKRSRCPTRATHRCWPRQIRLRASWSLSAGAIHRPALAAKNRLPHYRSDSIFKRLLSRHGRARKGCTDPHPSWPGERREAPSSRLKSRPSTSCSVAERRGCPRQARA